MATLSTATVLLLCSAIIAFGLPVSRCDVNQDGSTNVTDVQDIVNQALGAVRANNDLNSDGVVNVVDVQIEANAVFGLGCPPDSILPLPLPPGVSGPLITSLPPAAAVVGKSMQYQVVTSSAAPASLIYSLSAGPSDMAIGVNSGLIQWSPAASDAGDQSITIVAQDSLGQTSQSFTLSVFALIPEVSVPISAQSGGTITVNDPQSPLNGLSVSIPPGALASDTTISVSTLVPPATLGGSPRFFLQGFSIEPDGTQLASPATVTIPYNPAQFSTTQGIALENFLGVYYVQTETGNLQYMNTFSVNSTTHVMTGTLPHFSVWAVTDAARLCPPPTAQTDCPNTYAPATASLFLPALMVHGFIAGLSPAMGDESTWGQLRYLLSQQLDSGMAGRIDAWRFDWDSVYVPFGQSAENLAYGLIALESLLPSPPNVVNIVTHSFGGILTRTYLTGQGGIAPYNQDVNSVISLGTPYQGIGGTFSTFFATACASAAQSYPTVLVTCFESGTGHPGSGEGGYLNAVNSLPLPALQTSNSPQFDAVIGQRVGGLLCAAGSCSLQPDDGLITTAGNQFCGGANPGCSAASFLQEINPGNFAAGFGLCHSGALSSTTCLAGIGYGNYAMAAVDGVQHPMWDKICTFLGCEPAINITISPRATPAEGSVTISPPSSCGSSQNQACQFVSTCSQTCTGLYPAGTAVTLTATPATGYTFSGWSGDCTGTSNQCILDILPIDTKPGGYQVTAIFTQGLITPLITATCTGVSTITGPNNQPMTSVTTTFSGTVPASAGYFINMGGTPTPGASEFEVLGSLDGVSYGVISSYQFSEAPFNCGSWTPAVYNVFVSGYGYFNTSCVDNNQPATNSNWQLTITITTGAVDGAVEPFYKIVDTLNVIGGSPLTLTASVTGIANCQVQ
jgi:uncharacterized repeat protein (TIGR02543 family)